MVNDVLWINRIPSGKPCQMKTIAYLHLREETMDGYQMETNIFNLTIFRCVQGVEKGYIGNKWVNINDFTHKIITGNLLGHLQVKVH